MKVYSPLSTAIANLFCFLIWMFLWTMCSYSIEREIVLFAFYSIMAAMTGAAGAVLLYLHVQGFFGKSASQLRDVDGVDGD